VSQAKSVHFLAYEVSRGAISCGGVGAGVDRHRDPCVFVFVVCFYGLRRFASVRFALIPLSLLTPSLLADQAPLSFESRIGANGDGEAVLTNRSNAPIVAYFFEILREPCNPIEADRHTYAGFDAGITPDGKAIQPFTSRIQDIGTSHCNKDGTHSPAKASLKAVLFADGTKFGDLRWVTILLQNRKYELQKIDGATNVLREIRGNQTRQENVALLEKAKDTFPRLNEPQVDFYDVDPFETAIRQLTGNQTAPAENQIADLLAALKAERARIQNELHLSQ
jgi:hypothetical protein